MILYVDYEHASTYENPKSGRLLAARTRISYMLQDLSGHRCLLQRYGDVGADIIDELGIAAVFISGNGASPDLYDPDDLVGLTDIVRSGRTPVFGFCGGLQFIGTALGARLDRIGRLGVAEIDEHPDYEPGWKKELGYQPVELLGDHPLLSGLDRAPVFRHAHTQELKGVPVGFVNLARTDTTELQYLAHETLPLAGTQFHPEYWTEDHPAGRTLIANFCDWVGVSRSA
ncbi:MAG TPA: gamma-glutamyl-gamma-aminobutyrate hydrolase family protein [Ilumatobacteraceae bacterium]|nr:gamma-glutamyl-gamma-aminobutyrate hydrolase family protein [Ilumatobacteraceae bacterium]